MRSETVRVHAALITVSLIYGYFYVAAKLLLRQLHPSEFILLRFVLTALIVFTIDRLFIKKPFPQGKDLVQVVAWGLLGVFLVQILVILGLHYSTAFHTALIMATVPILTLLFSIVTGRETFHWQKLAGIIIGFVGVAVLLFFTKKPGVPLPETYLVGDAIVLFNAMAFSCFLLGSQKMLRKYSSFSFMAYCYMISAVVFSTLFLGGNQVMNGHSGLGFLQHFHLQGWELIVYVVLFASIGSYTLNNYALRRVSPSIVAVYCFIQPIISAVTGYYLLGEPFSLEMAVATAITFIGVMLATTASEKDGVYLRKTDSISTDLHDADPEAEKAEVG